MKMIFNVQERPFRIFVLIWGILFLFLLPPWQGPDEYYHMEFIGNEIKNENIAKTIFDEVPLDEHAVRWNSEWKIDVNLAFEAMGKKAQYNTAELLPRGFTIQVVRHLPATIGIVIGVLLNLPAYWVLILGKLCSLMFYVVICSIALRLMPIEKDILKTVMLLPMTIQQAVSIGYDAVAIPTCFLFTAYVLYLKFEASNIGLRELAIMAVLLYCIAMSKIPYVAIGGLVFLIPFRKLNIKLGKYVVTGDKIGGFKWLIIGIVLALAAVGIYLNRNYYLIKLLGATFMHLPRTIWLFARTWKVWSADIFQTLIANFGWMEVPGATWFVAMVAAFVIVLSMTVVKEKGYGKYRLSVRDNITIYVVLASCFYLTSVSMILFTADTLGIDNSDWNKVLFEIIDIHGLQGRYYLVMLPLLLIPWPKIFEMKSRDYKIVTTAMYIFMAIYTCSIIGLRYWKI